MNDSSMAIQERLRRLPGVVEVRAQADAAGVPLAVYVRAAEGADPDRLLDHVVATFAEAGIALSPALVQLDFEPALESVGLEELEVEGRVRLVAFQLRVDELGTHAEVELGFGSDRTRGAASLRGGAPAPEILAHACLDALERLCHARVALRLAGVQRATLPTGEVYCVAVQEIAGRTARVHTGIAPIGEDPARAIAYAALGAINRPFGRILTGPTRHIDLA